MLIDVIVFTSFERNLFDYFTNKLRNDQASLSPKSIGPRFLTSDLDGRGQFFRVVSHDLSPDTILERRNDLSARGVILGVRRKHQHHVERKPHRITLNLHIAFLHDVEETDLDFP